MRLRSIGAAILAAFVAGATAAVSQDLPSVEQTTGQWPPADAFTSKDPAVRLPSVLREVKPQYTREAMGARVQGSVLLEGVVEPDGMIQRVRVVRSLDRTYGLDDEAVRSARQWRFRPGTRNGEVVPVLVTLELTFTLRQSPGEPAAK